MIVKHLAFRRATEGNDQILDLTAAVQGAIADSGVATGQAALLVQGSTAALTTLEYEPGLVGNDVAQALERLAPRDGR